MSDRNGNSSFMQDRVGGQDFRPPSKFSLADDLDTKLRWAMEHRGRLEDVLARIRGHQPQPIKQAAAISGVPEIITIRQRLDLLQEIQSETGQMIEELSNLI